MLATTYAGGGAGAGVEINLPGGGLEEWGGGTEWRMQVLAATPEVVEEVQAMNWTGGSGVVIVRYPNTYTITVGAGLTSSTTTDGSDKVTSFTAGTDTISFS